MDEDVSRPRPTKRKRISRACDPCRARKHRCDGRQPTCSACSRIQRPCSYDSSTKRRGLPTGYVRSLELLWALVFTVVPDSMSIVNELIPEIQFALDSHARLGIVSRLVNDPEILRQGWEDSGVQTELEYLLANVNDNINTDATPTYLGKKEETTADLPQLTVRSFKAIQSELARPISDPTTWPRDTNKVETPPLPRLSMVPAASAEDVRSTPFPQNARRLLDLYFAHTHCWLPIVQKHKMFEILYSPSRIALADAGSLAVFLATLAYSALQESRGPFGLAGAPDSRDALFTPEQLYVKARQQVPNEEAQDPDFAQALLILSLFKLDRGEVAASWHLIGQAVRIALDFLPLPFDSSGSSTAAYSGDDDKHIRLLLSCFVLDTVVSCHLGKPPHLRTADILCLPMPAETGPDEWEPQTACFGESESRRRISSTWDYQPLRAISIFNRYVDLIRILNDAMSEPPMGVSEELCAKHSFALRRWYDQLPQHCVFPSTSNQNRLEDARGLSPQLINLHVAFKTIQLFLKTQQGSISRYGPSLSTPGTKPSLPSTMRLVSTFATKFGVSTIPAIFTSYKAIDDRKPTRLGVVTPNSNRTRPNPPENYPPMVSTSDSAVHYLPTPTEYPEYPVAGGSGIVTFAGLLPSGKARGDSLTDTEHSDDEQRCSSIADPTHEHEKEAWKDLFDIVEIGEAGVSNFSYHGDLDHLGGIEWSA